MIEPPPDQVEPTADLSGPPAPAEPASLPVLVKRPSAEQIRDPILRFFPSVCIVASVFAAGFAIGAPIATWLQFLPSPPGSPPGTQPGFLYCLSGLLLIFALILFVAAQNMVCMLSLRQAQLEIYPECVISRGPGIVVAGRWTDFSGIGKTVVLGRGAESLMFRVPPDWPVPAPICCAPVRGIPLETYEPNWRQGQIGEAIARFAPWLLASVDSSPGR